MRRIALPALVLALAAARASAGDEKQAGKPPAPSTGHGPHEAKPRIAWATSFLDAIDEARERNVLIFLHSHANTCPPCKAIARTVFEDPDYVAWANGETIHVLSYDIHADADPE